MNNINLSQLEPKIVTVSEINLVACSSTMSFAMDRTSELWCNFGSVIKDIPHIKSSDKYSVQIFPNPDFFKNFDPNAIFRKYAAVEVDSSKNIPDGLGRVLNLRPFN